MKSPRPAGLYGRGGGRYKFKSSPGTDRVLCEIQGVERRLSDAATWERAERLRVGKGKKQTMGCTRSALLPASRLGCSKCRAQAQHRRSEAAPASGCGPVR